MKTIKEREKHLDDLLEDNSNVLGEIYMIINLLDNKLYIGQTVSHRKNHGKYRPFGYPKRFKEHIGEALTQLSKPGAPCLDNAIREDGAENFTVELIKRCELNEKDHYEQYFIEAYQSIYPHGYNLTPGGIYVITPVAKVSNDKMVPLPKLPYKHSEETKQKIALRSKEHNNKPEVQLQRMESAQKQHDKEKLKKFANVRIDHNHLEQYLQLIHSRDSEYEYYYTVKIDGIEANFMGKHQPIEEVKARALDFLKQLPSI